MQSICWKGLVLIGCVASAVAVKRPLAPLSFLEQEVFRDKEVLNQIHDAVTGLSSSRHFSSHLESLEDGLVALMGHKAESPYLTKAIDNILLVTRTSLKKGIIDQHAVAQQAVLNADQAVMTCHGALQRELKASHAVRDALVVKNKAVQECHQSSTAAERTSLLALPRLLSEKATACKGFLSASDESQAPFQAWASACEGREASVGTYLMKQLMHWEALLEQYDAMEHRCTESIELYSAEVKRYSSLKGRRLGGADCAALQDDMDTKACKQALQRMEACGAYRNCINETIAHRVTAQASWCKGEDDLKDEWYAMSTMECFLKAFRDKGNLEDLKLDLARCKSLPRAHYNISRFTLEGCHSIKADLATALSHSASLPCDIDPSKDPSMAGTEAYEATYYRGFEPERCNATCCLHPPYPTTTTTTTTSTTTTTETTTTTTSTKTSTTTTTETSTTITSTITNTSSTTTTGTSTTTTSTLTNTSTSTSTGTSTTTTTSTLTNTSTSTSTGTSTTTTTSTLTNTSTSTSTGTSTSTSTLTNTSTSTSTGTSTTTTTSTLTNTSTSTSTGTSTSTSTLTNTSTSTSTGTSTTTTAVAAKALPSASCNAATVALEVSTEGTCERMRDSERWYAYLLPSPDTDQEDLKALGLALAARSARLFKQSTIPKDSVPHVMMDESRLKLFLESAGSCADQQLAVAKLFPHGRKIILHRCKDSDSVFF